MIRGGSYHHLIFRLASVSDWQTRPPAETVSAERIARWHPAVAALRKDKRLDSLGKELRTTGFRLLQALAREAEARGYTVGQRILDRYGYAQNRRELNGQLIFKVNGIECSVAISQPTDRVDHTPTPEEVAREKKYHWPPARYDYVPANRLKITIDTTSRFATKQSWTETKSLPLHARLPDVMMCFERWAVIDAERLEAERLAEVERQERERREEELARQAYIEHALGQRLIADADAWDLVGRLRRYLTEMTVRIEDLSDADDRAAADEWLRWCEEYVATRDPFSRPIRRPQVKAPGYSDLLEFRKRLGRS